MCILMFAFVNRSNNQTRASLNSTSLAISESANGAACPPSEWGIDINPLVKEWYSQPPPGYSIGFKFLSDTHSRDKLLFQKFKSC